MSESFESLNHKISGAKELKSVVSTMKALAASNIVQYEKSVLALDDYYHTTELGLSACFQGTIPSELPQPKKEKSENHTLKAVVFGSDQGLVGQFNDIAVEYAIRTLAQLPGKPEIWAVGERTYELLTDSGLQMAGQFNVPTSVNAITPLVASILIETEENKRPGEVPELFLFYNRHAPGSLYNPMHQRLLPLDELWLKGISELKWPTKLLPEVFGNRRNTLAALIHEYLFASIFRACAESLASENASRLASMQRADKNIGELLEDLGVTFQSLRQSSIDEELFDVISGFESMSKTK